MLTKGSTSIMDNCMGYDFATEITFMPNATDSRLFGKNAPKSVLKYLQEEPVTANFHNYCMRPENFTADLTLSNFYKILSISEDLENKTFISTIESQKYPIFGVQWHPEKNGFEWRPNTTIPHSKNAVTVMQYMANFFTD
ncbi:unnamed protein product, partial [Didymodactylos carnosus]